MTKLTLYFDCYQFLIFLTYTAFLFEEWNTDIDQELEMCCDILHENYMMPRKVWKSVPGDKEYERWQWMVTMWETNGCEDSDKFNKTMCHFSFPIPGYFPKTLYCN